MTSENPFSELSKLSIDLLIFDVAFEVFVEVRLFFNAILEKSNAHASRAHPRPSTKAVTSFTS